ncbi:hypothetical protein ONZ45_g2787 [Pleurotus djamor]|nr:hypothetical protein ONZ45_g2787 [Pleurotus djamor]
MAYRGTDNLRCYIREAQLPQLKCDPSAPEVPPSGHKSHLNHLRVRNEPWRHLQRTVKLPDEPLEKHIMEWTEELIPDQSLCIEDEDSATGERLSIPCSPVFAISRPWLRRPPDLSRLSSWIDNLVLMTTQRILHLLWPSTAGWGFQRSPNLAKDNDIIDYFMWTRDIVDPARIAEVGYESLLVVYQPPWILSSQDMDEFIKCRSMPPSHLNGQEYPKPLQSSERLWAKTWDKCRSNNTRCYNQWAFGVFTKGWTAGFITVRYALTKNGPDPSVPSESYWDGKSQAAGTSAGVLSIMSPQISEVGLPLLPRPHRKSKTREHIEAWVLGNRLQEQENPADFEANNATPGPSTGNQMPALTGHWIF